MSDDDIDNMDFDLPPEMLQAPPSVPAPVENPFAQMMDQQGMEFLSPIADFDNSNLQLTKNWTVVYPIYINAAVSAKKGRRVPTQDAIVDPTAIYMAEAVKKFIGLDVALEVTKRHPRDHFTFGRLRVKLRSDKGKAINPNIQTKSQLILKIAQVYESAKSQMEDTEGKVKAFSDHSRSVLAPWKDESEKKESIKSSTLPKANPVQSKIKNKKK